MNINYETLDTSFSLEFDEVQNVGGIKVEGTQIITENGTHDVASFETAEVNVPIPDGYVLPEGEVNILENGEYDVELYRKANVHIPTPEGTINITENGVHDVAGFASAKVNVDTGVKITGEVGQYLLITDVDEAGDVTNCELTDLQSAEGVSF